MLISTWWRVFACSLGKFRKSRYFSLVPATSFHLVNRIHSGVVCCTLALVAGYARVLREKISNHDDHVLRVCRFVHDAFACNLDTASDTTYTSYSSCLPVC